MANIPVSVAIDNLLKSTPSTTVTTAAALTALGAVTTSSAATGLNMSTARILGRTTASAGAVEEITVGAGLSLSSGILDKGATTVVGPTTADDNAIARFDTGTGKLLQNSLVTVSDAGAITTPQSTASVIPFYHATFASFPAAGAANHGAIAHADDTGAKYYSHGGSWVKMLDASGTSIRTVNGSSLLGNGDVAVTGSDVINVTAAPYNAVADGKLGENGVMTSGGYTLTGTGFATTGLGGKFIRVVGAGAGGADLITTIASSTSTVLTLTAAAGTTVSAAQFFYGTDNTAAINSAIDAARASTTIKTVLIPTGKYICNIEGAGDVHIKGCGGYAGQSAYSPSGLAASSYKTFLLPALATKGVIYYRTIGASLKGASNATISDIVFLGGNGTNAANRKGIGMECAESLSTSGSAAGFVGGRIIRCEFNGFKVGLSFSRSWANIIDQCIVNFCETGFLLGGLDGSGNYVSYGGNDSFIFNACASTYTDVVFRFYGSKQATIDTGDFNYMEKLCITDNSKIFVSAINIENIDQGVSTERCIFHIKNAYGPSFLDVSEINGIGIVNKIFDERGNEENVSVNFGTSIDYYTISSAGYPKNLPPSSKIIRCTNNTWTVISRTEEWSHLMTNFDNIKNPALVEEYIKGGASPYGSLAWLVTNISGTTAIAALQGEGLSLYQDAANETCRFMPEAEMTNFATNFRLRFRYKFAFNVGTTVLRMGLYSRDATVIMTPANGIGMRLDTVTAGDTTVKLEVIVAGVIQTVVDTGYAISSMAPQRDLVIEKRGSVVRMVVLDIANSTPVFNQVVYSGTMPSGASYASPGIFLSGSTSQQLNVRRMLYNVFE